MGGGLKEIQMIMVLVGESISLGDARRKKSQYWEGVKRKLILVNVMHSKNYFLVSNKSIKFKSE